jgi:hypothetical protein
VIELGTKISTKKGKRSYLVMNEDRARIDAATDTCKCSCLISEISATRQSDASKLAAPTDNLSNMSKKVSQVMTFTIGNGEG